MRFDSDDPVVQTLRFSVAELSRGTGQRFQVDFRPVGNEWRARLELATIREDGRPGMPIVLTGYDDPYYLDGMVAGMQRALQLYGTCFDAWQLPVPPLDSTGELADRGYGVGRLESASGEFSILIYHLPFPPLIQRFLDYGSTDVRGIVLGDAPTLARRRLRDFVLVRLLNATTALYKEAPATCHVCGTRAGTLEVLASDPKEG